MPKSIRQTARSGAKTDSTAGANSTPLAKPKVPFYETTGGAVVCLLAALWVAMLVVNCAPDKPIATRVVSPPQQPTAAELARQAQQHKADDLKVQAASRQAACNNIDDFYDKLRDVTRRHLKAPSTAKFGYFGDEGVRGKGPVDEPDGSCSYWIQSYVDAENDFGAHIRTRIIGKVLMKDYAFRVEQFAMDE